jgi:hypothetical protein
MTWRAQEAATATAPAATTAVPRAEYQPAAIVAAVAATQVASAALMIRVCRP